MGYSWDDQFFVDTRLPFGSRSSPFIFSTFADLLLWILVVVFGILYAIHYLDDFLLVGSSEVECQVYMGRMSSLFSELGIPLADDMAVGPSQIVTYLGIEINSVDQSIRLPQDKYLELLQLLEFWKGRKKCTKRELLSLIGSLSFASKVVKPGRMFLRCLIDLSHSVSSLNHHISLNADSCADICWWIDFLPSWNGVNFMHAEPITSVSLSLFTDASGVGFGALYDCKWFLAEWPVTLRSFHINVQELFAIVAAVCSWGEGMA